MAKSEGAKKAEFFSVLNLIAVKKVKVRYCRTIKERLRPSTTEESLALPIKPKSPTKRKIVDKDEGDGGFLTPPPGGSVSKKIKLRGGVSLIKYYKSKRKIQLSPSAVPSSKSLLSYLQHKVGDEDLGDSSSIDSDCESISSFDNIKMRKTFVSVSRLSPTKYRRLNPCPPRFKEESKMMKGFEDEAITETEKSQKNLTALIDGLETEIVDEEYFSTFGLHKAAEEQETIELGEESNNVVENTLAMQMVEDFALASETDTEEDIESMKDLNETVDLEDVDDSSCHSEDFYCKDDCILERVTESDNSDEIYTQSSTDNIDKTGLVRKMGENVTIGASHRQIKVFGINNDFNVPEVKSELNCVLVNSENIRESLSENALESVMNEDKKHSNSESVNSKNDKVSFLDHLELKLVDLSIPMSEILHLDTMEQQLKLLTIPRDDIKEKQCSHKSNILDLLIARMQMESRREARKRHVRSKKENGCDLNSLILVRFCYIPPPTIKEKICLKYEQKVLKNGGGAIIKLFRPEEEEILKSRKVYRIEEETEKEHGSTILVRKQYTIDIPLQRVVLVMKDGESQIEDIRGLSPLSPEFSPEPEEAPELIYKYQMANIDRDLPAVMRRKKVKKKRRFEEKKKSRVKTIEDYIREAKLDASKTTNSPANVPDFHSKNVLPRLESFETIDEGLILSDVFPDGSYTYDIISDGQSQEQDLHGHDDQSVDYKDDVQSADITGASNVDDNINSDSYHAPLPLAIASDCEVFSLKTSGDNVIAKTEDVCPISVNIQSKTEDDISYSVYVPMEYKGGDNISAKSGVKNRLSVDILTEYEDGENIITRNEVESSHSIDISTECEDENVITKIEVESSHSIDISTECEDENVVCNKIVNEPSNLSESLESNLSTDMSASIDLGDDDDTEEDTVTSKEYDDLWCKLQKDSSKIFQCDICNKLLNTKNGLDYHMRTHSGISPFECDICHKRFKSSSLCSRHRQIHESFKKYVCSICNKSFAQKSNLSKHMDIHAGFKPFQCPVCPKSFTQKVHLDCHVMTHTKDKPWKCHTCSTRFSKKSSLIRHCQNVHKSDTDNHEISDDESRPLIVQTKEEKPQEEPQIKSLNSKPAVLQVIPLHGKVVGKVENPHMDQLVQKDLSEANRQFDVEVSYCQPDIDTFLSVPDDTLFIMEDNLNEDEQQKQGDELSVAEEDDDVNVSEQIEDIEKFLLQSSMDKDVSETAESSKKVTIENTPQMNECSVDEHALIPGEIKKSKYRIPKSPLKINTKIFKNYPLGPHISPGRKVNLKVIGLSKKSSVDKIENISKSKHSFEDALNEASSRPAAKRINKFLELTPKSRSIAKTIEFKQSQLSKATDMELLVAAKKSSHFYTSPIKEQNKPHSMPFKSTVIPLIASLQSKSDVPTSMQIRYSSFKSDASQSGFKPQTSQNKSEHFSQQSKSDKMSLVQKDRKLPTSSLPSQQSYTKPVVCTSKDSNFTQKTSNPSKVHISRSKPLNLSHTNQKAEIRTQVLSQQKPHKIRPNQLGISTNMDLLIKPVSVINRPTSPDTMSIYRSRMPDKMLVHRPKSPDKMSIHRPKTPDKMSINRPLPSDKMSIKLEPKHMTKPVNLIHRPTTPDKMSIRLESPLSSIFRPHQKASQQGTVYIAKPVKTDPMEQDSKVPKKFTSPTSIPPIQIIDSSESLANRSSAITYKNQAFIEPIKRQESTSELDPMKTLDSSQGYYTSSQNRGWGDVNKSAESTDVESEEDTRHQNQQIHVPIFLPTNFPTFNNETSGDTFLSRSQISSSFSSTHSSISSTNSIGFMGIKPTAVVSPSRPRMATLNLPKPVPAALASSSPILVEKLPTARCFTCSVCELEFSSQATLFSHKQSVHWRL